MTAMSRDHELQFMHMRVCAQGCDYGGKHIYVCGCPCMSLVHTCRCGVCIFLSFSG